MPIIVSMSSGKQYLIAGEATPDKLWKPGKIITALNLTSGREMKIHASQITATEVWPKAEYDAEKKAQADAEAEEHKRNPNPGHAPRILIPRKPS